MHPLSASSYTGIENRTTSIVEVKEALDAVINAQPTQVDPVERQLYLDAIVDDLEDREEAPWVKWPEEIYLLALTAIKCLGRNPVGSETLFEPDHLSTILYHSGLPFPSPNRSSPSSIIRVPPNSISAPALEALKILANLLVLHAAGRDQFANAGGAKAIARALANKDDAGNDMIVPVCVERLFLLGRLGFLVTLDRTRAVELMVNHADIVDSLVFHLSTVPVLPSNYTALSEVLKLTNNVLRFYPLENSQGSSSRTIPLEDEPWNERFDLLLPALLNLFYVIPFVDLAPPLSQVIHTLISIPFLPHLLPAWQSIPEPVTPIGSAPSPMKAFLNKLSNMSTSNTTSANQQPRRSSAGSVAPLSPPKASERSPSATSSSRGSISSSSRRGSAPCASANDHTALLNRLLRILECFLETYLPYPKKPDDPLPQGLVLDEALPPLLLLLTRAAAGDKAMRKHLKDTLLPPTLDRSPGAGPLEARKGLLGDILRLVGCAGHQQTRDSVRELLWAVCDSDPSTLSVEIGYGNAAGILFQKGISGPPPAKIEEIEHEPSSLQRSSHDSTSRSANAITKTASANDQSHLNPITALRDTDESSRALDEMTQEEKEREAERLFVLFDRMEKNPVISMKKKGDGDDGVADAGKSVNIQEMMREKLGRGEVDEWDRKDEEEERRRQEEVDKNDEEEAMREVGEYRRRMGRK